MSYWKEEGFTVDGSEKSCVPSGFGVIPNETMAVAKINEVIAKEFEGNKYWTVEWEIVDGQYKPQRVWQNLYVNHKEPQKRAKAKNMMLRIFTLCGHPTSDNAPMISDFMCLKKNILKIFIKSFKIEEKDGNEARQGNYIYCVYENSALQHSIESKENNNSSSVSQDSENNFTDDDLPF